MEIIRGLLGIQLCTVFERGLKAIPLSVDLWLHYLTFVIEKYAKAEDGTEKIRNLYNRAITTAGKDFRSDKLWDSYIKWEKDQNNFVEVTALYDQLLKIPTQLYSHNFESFKSHVESHPPKDILSLDEFLKLRKEIVKITSIPGLGEEDDGPPGDDAGPPGVEDGPPGLDDAPPGLDSHKLTEEEIPALRTKILQIREETHRKTEAEVSKRWTFEEMIKRPYFHVKPLERAQLKNWRDYLDFEIENGTNEHIVVLFERCMIACALYEDFWLKYANYLESHSIDAVRNVFKRACKIHLPKKPNIHLAWASFEEKQGNFNEAWEILSTLETAVPKLAMVRLRRIGLERRRGNLPEIIQMFEESITDAPSAEVSSFFSLKYCRYLAKILGKVDEAREVIKKAIEKDKTNTKLYLQFIDTEYQCQPINEDKILQIMDSVLDNNDIPAATKFSFSQRKLEFLEDFGCDIEKLNETYNTHQKLLKETQSQKKRKPQEPAESEPAAKWPKEDYSGANGTNHTAHVGSGDTQTQAYPQWNTYSQYQNYSYPQGQWGGYNTYYPS